MSGLDPADRRRTVALRLTAFGLAAIVWVPALVLAAWSPDIFGAVLTAIASGVVPRPITALLLAVCFGVGLVAIHNEWRNDQRRKFRLAAGVSTASDEALLCEKCGYPLQSAEPPAPTERS